MPGHHLHLFVGVSELGGMPEPRADGRRDKTVAAVAVEHRLQLLEHRHQAVPFVARHDRQELMRLHPERIGAWKTLVRHQLKMLADRLGRELPVNRHIHESGGAEAELLEHDGERFRMMRNAVPVAELVIDIFQFGNIVIAVQYGLLLPQLAEDLFFLLEPGQNITRADFIALLVRALGLKSDFDSNFSDVNPSDYYYLAIGIAKKLGITDGVGDNKFNPKEKISRQDLMVLTARALDVSKKLEIRGDAGDLASYSDNAAVASYATNSVAAMVKAGIVEGNGSGLNPQGQATRAETAVILYRIFKKL